MTHCTAKFRLHPPPSWSSSSCSKTRKSPAVPCHPVWVSRGGHRRRSSSAPLSSSPTSYPWCRTPGLLEGIRWWRCCGSLRCRLSCRSSQCLDLFGPGPPTFCHSSSAEGRTVGGSGDGARIFTGGRCRAGPGAEGSSDTGGAGRGQSSSSGSAGVAEVFKVLSQYRIQQRMWSRSLMFQLVEVFQVLAQDRVPHRVDFFTMQIREFKGFSHFSQAQKKCGGTPPVECESARQCQLIRTERSSNGSCRGV